MKNAIVGILLAVAALYTGAQVLTMYMTKSNLNQRVEASLDAVSETSINKVKQDLVAEAQKLGVPLSPADIEIKYEDTSIQSYAQNVVGAKLGVQYTNKRIAITARYVARVLGFSVKQEIEEFKIRQVEAPKLPASKAAQEVLDTR